MVELLKELVNRLQNLEQTVYDSDNVLMKSGFVKVSTPTPSVANDSELPDGNALAKMDWSEINDMMSKLEGK
jgi:hypothetical protein